MVRDSWDSWDSYLKLLKEKQKKLEKQNIILIKVFDLPNPPYPPSLYLLSNLGKNKI